MKKKGGFILTSEMVLIATVLVIGMLVGLVVVRDAVVAEMEDVAEAIGAMDQSYSFHGLQAPQNDSIPITVGTDFNDDVDTELGDSNDTGPSGGDDIVIIAADTTEVN